MSRRQVGKSDLSNYLSSMPFVSFLTTRSSFLSGLRDAVNAAPLSEPQAEVTPSNLAQSAESKQWPTGGLVIVLFWAFRVFKRQLPPPLCQILLLGWTGDSLSLLWRETARCRVLLFAAKMSDVVEKTLTALPSLLSLDSQPGSAKLSSTSKLGNLIRGITELTSKHVSLSLKTGAQVKEDELNVI